MKRILAIIMALILAAGACVALTSCSDNTDAETTTEVPVEEAIEGESVPEETQAATNAADVPAEDATQADGAEEATEPETTLAAVTAPVGGSAADILAYYNTAANQLKTYEGNMSVKRVQGTTSNLEEISIELARGVVEGILPNDWPQEKTVSTDGAGAKDLFPVDDKPYTSALTVDGVKSATCTQDGNGYKVVITLVSEKGNDINFKPKHHGSCMDTLALTQEDLDPLTINECEITYTGATITAKIDEYGRVTSLVVNEPVVIEGTVAWKSLNIIDVKVIGTWKQEFTVTY